MVLPLASEPAVLFVVRTPLQLFNSIEAYGRFHQGQCAYLVAIVGNVADQLIMTNMLNNHPIIWTDIYWLNFQGIDKRRYAFALNHWLKNLPTIDTVYIGMLSHVPIHVINQLPTQNIWLLDDGNEILLLLENLKNTIDQKPAWYYSLLQQNLDPKKLRQLNVFSEFDVASLTPNRYIINDYRYFKATNGYLLKTSHQLMIGSNLVGNYIKDEPTYLRHLKQLYDCMLAYGDEQSHIYYAGHRYESDSLLEQIYQLGYEPYHYDTILEYAIQEHGWTFKNSVSIRSTASQTLARIYQIPSYIVELPSTSFVSEEKYRECCTIWDLYPSQRQIVLS